MKYKGKALTPESIRVTLEHFEAELKDSATIISVSKKKLEDSIVEQPAWFAYYDGLRVDLYYINKTIDLYLKKRRSEIIADIDKHHPKILTEKAKDQFVYNNNEFFELAVAQLEVEELLSKYESTIDAFKQRGFALNNIVKLRTAAMEGVLIGG